MPTTRKKVIKTVYKDEDDSEADKFAGDFSDSGSEAEIPEHSSSDDDIEADPSSADEFDEKSKKKQRKSKTQITQKVRRINTKFAKDFINKIHRPSTASVDDEVATAPPWFSVKDMTDEDKLLPSVLNLSESDSSEDESPKVPVKKQPIPSTSSTQKLSDSESEAQVEYKDIWAQNLENSEEVAKKTFMELEQHKTKIEQTKASIMNYEAKTRTQHGGEFDVKDLLAQGEEVIPQLAPVKKRRKGKTAKEDSDSEMDDWEEVKEAKSIPQQGIQLVVDFPDAACRKKKKLDIEMMMKRKINRVKKEYQVYMHKVHVLCWLGHGNYVSRVLNDQEVMAAALSLVPKGCYPGERVDIKYVEQITTWYKDKFTLKQDKNENKFKPKAPPLKQILLEQIKSRTVTTKKYLVFIFVSMLRAIGLQCRIMFNFVTLPIKPPSSELCSLSTKPKENKPDGNIKKEQEKSKKKSTKSKAKSKIPQLDGQYDSSFTSDSDMDNLIQLDGNDDTAKVKTRSVRTSRANKNAIEPAADEDVSPPKRARRSPTPRNVKKAANNSEANNKDNKDLPQKRKKPTKQSQEKTEKSKDSVIKSSETSQIKQNGLDEEKDVAKMEIDQNSKAPNKTRPAAKTTGLKKAGTAKTDSKLDEPNIRNANKQQKDVCEKMEEDEDLKASNKTRGARKTTGSKKASASTTETKSNPPKVTKENSNKEKAVEKMEEDEDINVPKKTRVAPKTTVSKKASVSKLEPKSDPLNITITLNSSNNQRVVCEKMNEDEDLKAPKKTRVAPKTTGSKKASASKSETKLDVLKVTITNDNDETSKYFDSNIKSTKSLSLRKRSATAQPSQTMQMSQDEVIQPRTRTKSAPENSVETSKYFNDKKSSVKRTRVTKKEIALEDKQRVSHKDLIAKNKAKPSNDVTGDLIDIIKKRVKEAKEDSKKGKVKGKAKLESDDDSDHLPVEEPKRRKSESDEDFKPTKISPKARPSTGKKIDRRVLSSDTEETPKNKCDVWAEVYVEELEQWICVDVVKAKVHCPNEIYSRATHPVCYVVGWDNNNYLKDVTRRYVPHWNTVTRKARAEPAWWETAVAPYTGPRTARLCEEDDQLNRMQLDAPLPTSIAEYKNHPLYALKRHLLKFEAIYPPDAASLGFVRGEPVYARECVHVCRSRDTWLKEAKVVRLGEQPYKVVKARPKWDRLSNKLITDKPLEVFGPWQVQDYEPPVAENGLVPRNAYGNVELFKACMLPKGTVHIKLPGLNRVAKKLNIDCAPAMTGFDFNGGWSHPVYDGFVVCQEFEEIVTQAWLKDQEEQERREREKIDARVYGNWRRLIKGLLIRERLKDKYGFEDPPPPAQDKRKKGPRLVVKKS